ncbi:MAG: hypothetical protein HY650_10035 [Acidobacteria bacterium]|nr:hypothetical protein [Acidobacteriota bacterium]
MRRNPWVAALLLCLVAGAAGYGLRGLQPGSADSGRVTDGKADFYPPMDDAVLETGTPEESEPGFFSSLFRKEPVRVTIPPGTDLVGVLGESVSSRGTRAGEPVRIAVTQPIVVDGRIAIPAGSHLLGAVASSKRSGRVKGRAHVTLRFDRLATPTGIYSVVASPITRVAPGTKKRDAGIIGIGAGIGAAIGALAGGGQGAGIGALAGGGAGTGVVLATRGKETGFNQGERLSIRLIEPVMVQVKEG